ncbi:reverse transcriptase domain-containing protein [Tanacetum coccineum]
MWRRILMGCPLLVLSSSGDHTVNKMIESGNNKGTHVENVRQTPINSTVDSNLEDVGNVPVWVKLHGVSVTAFSEDGLSAIATKLGTSLMRDSFTSDMSMQSWGRSSYARAMIELRVDVELKDTIVVAMLKLVSEGFYICTIRVEYEWKPTRCTCCKVFGHVQDEYPKNIGSDVAKNLKKHNQAPRGVPVVLSGNKKKDVESRKEVSNPNPFDVLNSVKNDVDLGKNRRTSNLASKEANSSGYSFWNVGSSSTTTTPIVDKIDKLERLIIDGKLTLVDDEGKPLEKVDYSGDHDSDDEVKPIDNEMENFLVSKRVGYGTNSLLEQWMETYENADYDYDPYDDDIYKGQEIPDNIQSICDNLEIKVMFENGGKRGYEGFWVYVELQTVDTCVRFQHYAWVTSWFSSIIKPFLEFIVHERVVWIDVEGIPYHAWTQQTFDKIAAKRGTLIYTIDMGGTLIIIQAKEVTGWVLDFVEDMSKTEVEGKDDNDMVFDSKSNREMVNSENEEKERIKDFLNNEDLLSDDPFGCDELIKQSEVAKEVDDKSDPIFLPSFTPSLSPTSKVGAGVSMGDNINEVFKQNIKKQGGQKDGEDLNANEEVCEMQKVTNDEDGCTNSRSINMPFQLKSKILTDGFSMINKFNEVTEFGQALGYAMKGCEKDINCLAVRSLWGNAFSYYAMALAMGVSGEGLWLVTDTPLLIVYVYAPRDIGAKKVLWDRIMDIIKCWNGEVIIMGDFNKVLGASIVKGFLSNAVVVYVPSDGYMYTWSDKAGSKMSKIDSYVIGDSNVMVSLKNKLKFMKQKIKSWNKTKVEERNLNKKECVDKLSAINIHIDMGQGHERDVEDRWDEKTKYFYGIINKKQCHNAIRWILIDEDMVDDPMQVKHEFYNHFSSRFDAPDWIRPAIDTEVPSRLTYQVGILEEDITRDEVRKVVWECGSKKAPRLNGFTFEFFKKFWNLVGDDVFVAVSEFFIPGKFPRGCNSSFITLIPRVLDAKIVNDFRPISLIRCQYKIMGRILAKRLSVVIDDLQKALIMELKRRYFEDYYSDYQYVVSIKEDTAYPYLHSPKTTKETSSIRRIQRRPIRHIIDIVCEDSGRYQAWSLLQETPNTPQFDDLDFFEDFENEFLAIVYNDSQMSKSDLSTELILNPQNINEFDLNDETSLSEYDEDEQNVLYFNDLFPFNIIHPDDLKSEKDNDDNEIDIIQSSGDMALPPRDQRHPYLRYEGLQYTDADIADFEARLARIYKREVHRVQVFDFGGLSDLMAEGLSARRLMEHRDAQGGVDIGSVNVPYLLARYLRLFAAGRKSEAHISGGQFVARLAKHFGLLTEERLLGLIVIAPALPVIDMTELPDAVAGAYGAAEDAPAVNDDMPQAVPPPPRTQGERIARIEEVVDGMCELLQGQSEVLDHMARDFSRFATWTVTSLARMMDRAGVAYTSYSETPGEYQRPTRWRTDEASISTA